MLRRLIALAVGLALTIGVTIAFAAQPQFGAAASAVDYIKTLQNSDGGFPAFGSGSTPGSTLDAEFALVAQGTNPTTVTNAGNGPDDYLSGQAASYASDPGAAAKLAYGVALMGLDITNFGGQNLLAIMTSNYNSGTGSYGLDVFDEVFYTYALARAGQPIPSGVNPYVRSLQQGDGGWEFSPGFGTDSNTTAMVLEALQASGSASSSTAVLNGLAYLHTTQNTNGGFGYLVGAESDPDSTALVIQALVRASQNIDEPGPWAPSGNTPLEGLLSFRNMSTGAFQYGGFDSAFATYQAVPALMLAPFSSLQSIFSVGGVARLPDVTQGIEPAREPSNEGGAPIAIGWAVAGVTLAIGGGVAFKMRRRRRAA
jgi:hypothetical protein